MSCSLGHSKVIWREDRSLDFEVVIPRKEPSGAEAMSHQKRFTSIPTVPQSKVTQNRGSLPKALEWKKNINYQTFVQYFRLKYWQFSNASLSCYTKILPVNGTYFYFVLNSQKKNHTVPYININMNFIYHIHMCVCRIHTCKQDNHSDNHLYYLISAGQTVLKIFGEIAENLDDIANEIDKNVLASLVKNFSSNQSSNHSSNQSSNQSSDTEDCIGMYLYMYI